MVAMIQNMLLMGKCVVLKEIYKLELEGFVTYICSFLVCILIRCSFTLLTKISTLYFGAMQKSNIKVESRILDR